MKRGFLTIAYGQPNYVRMAKGLARSMRFHNPATNLALVTDSKDPELRALFDSLIPLDESFGSGVSQKLHVDQYTPYDQTLFVDSDCLAFANPEALWEMFRESNGFGVMGWTYLGLGDSHYAVEDMTTLLRLSGVERLGAFNSGLFYFDRSAASHNVFTTARGLSSRLKELGLKTFKNSPCADEPIFALSLELNAIPMLPWDAGRAMCTATADDLEGLESINVFTGQRRLIRYKTVTEPIILHFHMQAQDAFPYLRELSRLRLGLRYGRGVLPSIFAIPSIVRARIHYLASRASQRVRQHGLIGLIPERLELAWKRRFRSAAESAQ
jgi:hypothetical protein